MVVCLQVPDLSFTSEAGSPAVMTAPAGAIPVTAASVGFSKLKGVFKSFNGKVEVRVHLDYLDFWNLEVRVSLAVCMFIFLNCSPCEADQKQDWPPSDNSHI